MIVQEPEKIVERLRHTINTGKYGIDYTIIRRDRNNRLREEYIVGDDKIKTILLSITTDDYVKSEESNSDDFPEDIVHIFEKEVSLIRRYSEAEGIETQAVNLYIKFTWTKEGGHLIFISFHKAYDE